MFKYHQCENSVSHVRHLDILWWELYLNLILHCYLCQLFGLIYHVVILFQYFFFLNGFLMISQCTFINFRNDSGDGKNKSGANIDESNEPELGKIYNGKVANIVPFGCFVQLEGLHRRVEGLVHISQLRAEGRVTNVSDVVSRGSRVKVSYAVVCIWFLFVCIVVLDCVKK